MRLKSSSIFHPLLITSVLYFLSVLLIAPTGEFAINDDWAYVRQVEAFTLGNFNISSFITASFILQGLIGAGWSKLFGFSLSNLRLLTVFNTFFIIAASYLVLKELKTPKKLVLPILLLIAFNPLVYTSSMSFMSDNYFLTFVIVSIYFYIRFFNRTKLADLLLAGLFCGLSIFVRQIGIVLPIALAITAILKDLPKINSKAVKTIVIGFIVPLMYLWVGSMWPRYPYASYINTFPGLISMLPRIFSALAYFTLFAFPIIISYKLVLTNKAKYIYWGLIALLAILFFMLDVFPVGNVLSLEGFYMKNDFKNIHTIFNNVYFTFIAALAISVSFVRALFLLLSAPKKTIKETLLSKTKTFLTLSALGLFFIIFIGNDYYDRHLIPASIIFILLLGTTKSEEFINRKLSYAILGTMIVFSVFTQMDFINQTKLMWRQAIEIQNRTKYVTKIDLDSVYSKFYNAKGKNDYTGKVAQEAGGTPVCYVQQYTTSSDSLYSKSWNFINEGIENLIENPRIYRSTKSKKGPDIKKSLEKLWYNEEYMSPMFNLVGKKAYVGSWCLPLEND